LPFLSSTDHVDEIDTDINDSKIAHLVLCFGPFLQGQANPSKQSKNKEIALGTANIVQYYKLLKLRSRISSGMPSHQMSPGMKKQG
jgi:hypothetical protein